MTSARRNIAVAVLCLACATEAEAQRSAPTVADVRARLHSTVGAEVAWAAFDAATFRMRAAVPDLIGVLEAPPYIDGREKDYLVATLLDAIVEAGSQGGPAPDPTTLAQFFEQWPTQTLILFGRLGTDRDGILMNLLPRSSGQAWFGIANLLLARQPVPGLAAEVLRGVKLNLDITVMDSNEHTFSLLGPGAGEHGSISDYWRPRSYPPEAVYEFAWNVPGATVLSTGPRTVYYWRRITTGPVIDRVPSSYVGPDVDGRLDYVNVFLGRSDQPHLRERMFASIEWRDEQTFLARVDDERRQIENEYQGMLDSLIFQGYLTPGEAGDLPLQLNVWISDQRSSPSSPLPAIPPAH